MPDRKEAEDLKDYAEPPIELFLEWIVMSASVKTMYSLKRTNSYKPLSKDEATGLMFHGNDEDIGVNFKLKAQNGYGNYIFGDAMYTLKIKKGKEDIFHYVNFN